MAAISIAFICALLSIASPVTTAQLPLNRIGESLQCIAESFTAALPPGAWVERVDHVPAGGSYGEGPSNLGAPANATNLPELCALTINVTSSPISSYRFGIFLPVASNWNTKFLAIGNGAFLGGIDWLDMGPGPHYSMATLSTDTGHNSGTGDLSWALNAPEKKLDWGYRAVHGSVRIGKALTEAYYGNDISYSYWSGCSTGGRQGLKEIQISPDTFDGALIGAPAWDTKRLMPWITKLGTLNLPEGNAKAFTSISEFDLLAAEVLAQCDEMDGMKDNIISSPECCTPDFNVITCGQLDVDPSNCLKPEQIETVSEVYADYHTSSGDFVHPGLEISSENQWDVYQLSDNPAGFDMAYEKYFLYNDAEWDWAQFNDSVVADSERANPGNATADHYDISEFRTRGGKVVMYQGMADGVIATRSSSLYYSRTREAMGGDVGDFFRYFLVPGMQHCYLSPPGVDAPWMFGGWGQEAVLGEISDGWSVPGFKDPEHDALLALMDWVENGTAVEKIVATIWNEKQPDGVEVYRQRPICPYPQKAAYDGIADPDQSSSWACE